MSSESKTFLTPEVTGRKLADLYEKVEFAQTPPEMRRLHP
jgi:hypothetical protein